MTTLIASVISNRSLFNYIYILLICLVTENAESSTAKCDMFQELTNSTDSSNYYSAVRDQQPCAKQVNNSDVACKVSKWPSCLMQLATL